MTMKYLFFFLASSVWATPYPHPHELLPMEMSKVQKSAPAPALAKRLTGLPVLRVQIDWSEGEVYQLKALTKENSGTQALLKKASHRDKFGSYVAELKIHGKSYFDSIGMGKEYRRLAQSLSFRFPHIEGTGNLKLWAEHPQTGIHEVVLESTIDTASAQKLPEQKIETRLLREATGTAPIVFTIYADGYTQERKERFFSRAQQVIRALESSKFPGVENFRFLAVFAVSKTAIGTARDLGPKPIKRDAFLGLYFPHWNKFGRWYNVVYPTDEAQLRGAFGQVAYDYPLALIDDSAYWGVGNYRMYTAIPAEARQFDFLLLHEFGHFLGLNEEYEEEGRTELEFAPGIAEPWSANMTFHPRRGELKWEHLVAADTELPTIATWNTGSKVGAYPGGYAGSEPRGQNHKPVQYCTMNMGGAFCPVCVEGIQAQLKKDSGTQN